MKVPGITALALVGFALSSAPAAAQTADARGFVRALGGITFVSETGGLIGGGAGVRVAPHFDLIGEAGWFSNILPKSIQTDLDAAAPGLGGQFGRPLTIDGKARAWYGGAGVRVTGRANRVTPFAEVMAGRARGTSAITAIGAGADVSTGVERALGLPRTETHAMFTLGAGLHIDLGHSAGLELGYRFSRVQTHDPRINTGVIHAGLSVGLGHAR